MDEEKPTPCFIPECPNRGEKKPPLSHLAPEDARLCTTHWFEIQQIINRRAAEAQTIQNYRKRMKAEKKRKAH
jgi:hypothetical protein